MSEFLLTNELIYKSFIVGAKRVIQEKNSLNAINVFPVPDGDTGSKPAYVMDISTIVAMNAGIGTVAIAYIKGEK